MDIIIISIAALLTSLMTFFTGFGLGTILTPVFAIFFPIDVAILMITFAMMEIIPSLKNVQFDTNKLYLGGALSGFFGGLSGHQGAFRSAFLLKAGLSKEAFIATGVTIACLVDFTRLSVYFSKFLTSGVSDNAIYIISATLSAFVGAYFGLKLLKKITLNFLQFMVSILIILLAVLSGLGII